MHDEEPAVRLRLEVGQHGLRGGLDGFWGVVFGRHEEREGMPLGVGDR
jgi:hypothetical protein